MRKRRAVKLLELLVILVAVLTVRAFTSHAAGLGTIEGTINGNGAALSGAHVAVSGNGVNRMTTTDASGHFAIGGLADGTYKVIVAHTGFASAVTSVTLKNGAT